MFINIFDGDARDFFYNNVEEHMNFDEMDEVMMYVYGSDARRIQVLRTLEQLHFQSFIASSEITCEADGLTKLTAYINKLTPQCQPDFRSEAHKTKYLRDALVSCSRARSPIENIVSMNYSYNQCITALHEKIQSQIVFDEGEARMYDEK